MDTSLVMNRPLTPAPASKSSHEQLLNMWVIEHDAEVLLLTGDREDAADKECPPSCGWQYNERNECALHKAYSEARLGITRMPIIPIIAEPLSTLQLERVPWPCSCRWWTWCSPAASRWGLRCAWTPRMPRRSVSRLDRACAARAAGLKLGL